MYVSQTFLEVRGQLGEVDSVREACGDLGIELRASGLAAGTLTHGDISGLDQQVLKCGPGLEATPPLGAGWKLLGASSQTC